jgi:hypothetical protein
MYGNITIKLLCTLIKNRKKKNKCSCWGVTVSIYEFEVTIQSIAYTIIKIPYNPDTGTIFDTPNIRCVFFFLMNLSYMDMTDRIWKEHSGKELIFLFVFWMEELWNL